MSEQAWMRMTTPKTWLRAGKEWSSWLPLSTNRWVQAWKSVRRGLVRAKRWWDKRVENLILLNASDFYWTSRLYQELWYIMPHPVQRWTRPDLCLKAQQTHGLSGCISTRWPEDKYNSPTALLYFTCLLCLLSISPHPQLECKCYESKSFFATCNSIWRIISSQ